MERRRHTRSSKNVHSLRRQLGSITKLALLGVEHEFCRCRRRRCPPAARFDHLHLPSVQLLDRQPFMNIPRHLDTTVLRRHEKAQVLEDLFVIVKRDLPAKVRRPPTPRLTPVRAKIQHRWSTCGYVKVVEMEASEAGMVRNEEE